MLDWDEQYIELYHEAGDWKYLDRYIPVDDSLLKASLTTYDNDPEPNKSYSDVEFCIRDTFDILFGYFEGFHNNIASGLISFNEYYPHIMYWLDILTNNESEFKDAQFRKLVRDFVEYYGYGGVIKLFDWHLQRIKNTLI